MEHLEYFDFVLDEFSVGEYSEKFGGKKDINFKNIKIGLGRKPDLRKLDKDELADSIAYQSDKEYWLIRYHLAIRDDDQGGYKQVRWVSLEVNYKGDQAKIVGVFPKQEFVKLTSFKLSTGAGLDTNARLNLTDLMGTPELESISGVKAKAKAHLKGSLSTQFSKSFYQKSIEADGTGQVSGFWRFHRPDEPLLGDVGMHHIVEVPKGCLQKKRLKVEAFIEAELSTWAQRWYTQNREKGPIKLKVGKE